MTLGHGVVSVQRKDDCNACVWIFIGIEKVSKEPEKHEGFWRTSLVAWAGYLYTSVLNRND